MIHYIGDISIADAKVLRGQAEISKHILEFGCGASTQVLSYYTKGNVHSIDTEQVWIDKTKVHLKRLGISEGKVTISKWGEVAGLYDEKQQWDFVFDDGVDHLRLPFALYVWPAIKIGGWLAFHDQRRKPDFDNALKLIEVNWLEIGAVNFNHAHSNITFIQKKMSEPYSNWQIDENIDMSKW